MQNELRHAEGWTKKNHKYIRKEGNRYIYPEDLQTNRARREGISRRQTEFEEYHRQRRENRQNALNQQGSSDYKKLSQQHANRQAAANGKIVNPSYTLRDNEGNKIARLQSKDKVPSPNQADYKQYSKERSNVQKRNAAAGSPNEYVRNQEHAKKMTNIMNSPAIHPRYKDGIGPSPMSKQRGKLALRKQGAETDYKTLSTKHNQEQNRKKAANGGPSKHGVLYYNKNTNSLDKDYYTSDQEWAKDRTSKGSGRSIRTKDQLNQKKRSKALNSQGSVNRQQEAKDFKEYQDWEKADQKKRDSEPKRKAALNKQGSKSYKYESELYGIRDKDNLSGVRDQVSQQDAKEMSKIHRNTSFQKNLRESNKENNNKMYKLKNRVTKAISNLKKKKTSKVDNSQEEYYNGKATKNTLKNDRDDTYDHLINNAKTKNERKKWQKEKGRLIGTRHYTNEHGVEYDEDVYTNSKAASRGEKRLNWTDRGDGHPINSWDKRGKMVQVAVKNGSDGGGWDVDKVTPENVKAKNYYNRKRKKK